MQITKPGESESLADQPLEYEKRADPSVALTPVPPANRARQKHWLIVDVGIMVE